MNKLKIGDVFLIVFIMLLTFIITFFNSEKGYNVIVEVDGEIIKTFDLNEENQFIYDGKYKNVITVKDGKVCVCDSNCPDKTCVNSGAINKKGAVIYCLPNRLVVRVTGTKNVDVISG